jgi:hypothetical protein
MIFGIVGAFFLVISYIYPVRKHLRWFAKLSTAAVLNFHTTATIVGATLAILHTGLVRGPNVATAAFVIMAVLMVSGLFGNYLYVHALQRSAKAEAALKKISGFVRIPEAIAAVRHMSGLRPVYREDEAEAEEPRPAGGSGRFARALQVWRVIHATASYLFLVILAAHIVVAVLYRAGSLWSLVRGSWPSS